MELDVNRGDIYLTKLPTAYDKKTNIQAGVRPCIIVSNYYCNKYSPIVTVVPLTSRTCKSQLPTHIIVGLESGLIKESIALVEQIQPVDRCNLLDCKGRCDDSIMLLIDSAIKIQIGLMDVAIDYSKIDYLMNKIIEKERFINKYHYISEIDQIIDDKEKYIKEFKLYCIERNLNFKQIISKYNIIKGNRGEKLVV
jgi:mRNA interferase MazF